MSKELIVTVIILVAIIALNFFVSQYVDDKFNYVLSEIDAMEDLVKDKNYEESEKKLDDIMQYWHKNEDLLSFFIEHDELEKVMTELTSFSAYLEIEDESAYESLKKTSYLIKHIEEKDDLKLKNIF